MDDNNDKGTVVIIAENVSDARIVVEKDGNATTTNAEEVAVGAELRAAVQRPTRPNPLDDNEEATTTTIMPAPILIDAAAITTGLNAAAAVVDETLSGTDKQTTTADQNAGRGKPITLETLPLDSLHAMAAFLSIADFCNGFGVVNKNCHAIHVEIMKRVRRHGFYCATQVIAAYNVAEEPDDAVQLAGLYISRGIPMYCNHSKAFGSIVFRMKHSGSGASGSTSTSVASSAALLHHHPHSFTRPNNFREGNCYLDEKRLLHPGKKLKIHQHLLELHQQHQQQNGTTTAGGTTIVSSNDIANRPFQLSLSADFFRRDGKQRQQHDAAATAAKNAKNNNNNNAMTTMKTKTKNNLGSFEFEVYSAESLCKDNPTLQAKIAIHQQKLERFLTKSDAAGVEECMLDFWDEFFPETRGVHYYDSETAVPRASHLHEFLTHPCPKAWGTVQCEIERIKTGSRLFPVYEYRLYVRGTPNDMELMFAKNKGRQEGKSNNYQIVMGAATGPQQQQGGGGGGDRHNKNIVLGRLQSNFIGTEFQIFVVASDHHHNNNKAVNDQPTKRVTNNNRRAVANHHQAITSSQSSNNNNNDYYAREDGAITYTANLLGSRPRIMDVCLPKIAVSDTDVTWLTYLASCAAAAGSGTDEAKNVVANALPTDMLTCFRQLVARLDNAAVNQNNNNNNVNGGNNNDGTANDNDGTANDNDETTELPDFGLLALQNRPPWWNHELQSFVLNFGGRVSVASVKNFQLIERSNHDLVMLQFGRIKGRHSFTMDFQYPLTAVQAFAIAISSLQSKISFG